MCAHPHRQGTVLIFHGVTSVPWIFIHGFAHLHRTTSIGESFEHWDCVQNYIWSESRQIISYQSLELIPTPQTFIQHCLYTLQNTFQVFPGFSAASLHHIGYSISNFHHGIALKCSQQHVATTNFHLEFSYSQSSHSLTRVIWSHHMLACNIIRSFPNACVIPVTWNSCSKLISFHQHGIIMEVPHEEFHL